jgi:hypothetical protein
MGSRNVVRQIKPANCALRITGRRFTLLWFNFKLDFRRLNAWPSDAEAFILLRNPQSITPALSGQPL